jgi:hypothetical protein
MLGFDASGHRIKDLQDHLITQPREIIKAADNHPCDFLLFYVQEYLRKLVKQSQIHGHLQPAGPFVWPSSPGTRDWEENQSNLRSLLRSRHALSRYISANYSGFEGPRPLLALTLKDYDYLIDETRENAAQLQGLLQNYTSLQAIKESQKGLEQADVVRKYVHLRCVVTDDFHINLRQKLILTVWTGLPYCTKVELKRVALFSFRPCQPRRHLIFTDVLPRNHP